MRSVPKLKELSAKHADQGLILIGIHSSRGGEKMPAFVKKQGIQYPVAWDKSGAMAKAFSVDGYPDYQVIDRSGNVRIADMANGALEATLEVLLAEPAPADSRSAVPAALQAVAKKAVQKETQILAVFGTLADHGKFNALKDGDRALSTLFRNEYQAAMLDAGSHADLLAAAGVTDGAAALVAFTAAGKAVGQRPLAGLDAAGLTKFLKQHQLAQKDANELWSAALAQAEREQKRVLVHLGAPW